MIKVLIADDHRLFRQALIRIFDEQTDIEVVAEASNYLEIMDNLGMHGVDVAILDMNMPGLSGTEMIRQVRLSYPRIGILVLTMHNDISYAHGALMAGANGFMTKEVAVEELVKAIHNLANGGRYLSQQMAESMSFNMSRDSLPHQSLSPRETTIFKMLVSGKRIVEIANELSLSIQTVSTHKANLLHKMHLHSIADLVIYATSHG